MKYYISKFQNGGWVSPEVLPVKVTQNTEGDSGYKGGSKHNFTNKTKEDSQEEFERKWKEKLEGQNTTSEIDENGLPRVIGTSGYDPLLGTAIEWTIGGKILGDVWKGLQYGLGKFGNIALKNWTRGRTIGSEMKNMPLGEYILPAVEETSLLAKGNNKVRPNQITWGRALTIIHDNYTGSPYENLMGTGDRFIWSNGNRQIEGLKGIRFGDYKGAGTEQIVYKDSFNPRQVLKIQSDISAKSPNNARINPLMNMRLSNRNQVPFQLHSKLEGFVKVGDRYYPVHKQAKITPLSEMPDVMFTKSIKPRILELLSQKGFYLNSGERYTNGIVTLEDIKPSNMGFDTNGLLKFFDVQAFTN